MAPVLTAGATTTTGFHNTNTRYKYDTILIRRIHDTRDSCIVCRTYNTPINTIHDTRNNRAPIYQIVLGAGNGVRIVRSSPKSPPSCFSAPVVWMAVAARSLWARRPLLRRRTQPDCHRQRHCLVSSGSGSRSTLGKLLRGLDRTTKTRRLASFSMA